MRTAPASDQKMSKESSPASQSKLIPASEALNTKVDKRSTVMHHTQTSSSSGANKIPGSPDTRDQKKTSPAPIHRPKRYALEMWLEVEVGPGLFVPPEDDSYSVDLLLRLLIELIQVLQECTWIELATCWPFMAEKAARDLA